MRKLGMEIARIIDGKTARSEQKQPFIEAAMARALGYALDLPTAEVAIERIRAHYEERHGPVVTKALSEINEHFVIDVKGVQALTYKFWRLRYDLVFNPTAESATGLLQYMAHSDDAHIPARTNEVLIENGDNPEFRRDVDVIMSSVLRATKDIYQEEAREAEAVTEQ